MQKSHPWLQACYLSLKIHNDIQLPTLFISNIKQHIVAQWSVEDLNVDIDHTNFLKLKIKKKLDSSNVHCTIVNSKVSQMLIWGKINVMVKNITFLMKSENTKPNIIITKGNLSIVNSRIVTEGGLKQKLFLTSTSSAILVQNTAMNGLKCGTGLIHIEDSLLYLHNVSVAHTGFGTSLSAIRLSRQSSVSVTDSRFSHNRGVNGSVFYISKGCHLAVVNSTLAWNIAGHSGGVIYSESSTSLKIHSSYFERNRALYGSLISVKTKTDKTQLPGGGVFKCHANVSIFIQNATFSNNHCDRCFGSLLLCGANATITIDHSTIESNVGNGSIIGGEFSKISVNNSNLTNNQRQNFGAASNVSLLLNYVNYQGAHQGVVSCLGSGCQVSVKNSLFESNIAAIYVSGASEVSFLRIESVKFLHHTSREVLINCLSSIAILNNSIFSQNGGVAVNIYQKSSAHIHNCTFHRNNNTKILTSYAKSNVTIHNTNFFDNSATVIIDIVGSWVTVLKSQLMYNFHGEHQLIFCRMCLLFSAEETNFTQNQGGMILDCIKGNIVLLKRCNFFNNGGPLVVGTRAKLTITNCLVTETKWTKPAVSALVLEQGAKVMVRNSIFSGHLWMSLFFHVTERSSFHFVNTIFKSPMLFVAEVESLMTFNNCSLVAKEKLAAHYFSSAWFDVTRTSTLHLVNTNADLWVVSFLNVQRNSTVLFDKCSINLTPLGNEKTQNYVKDSTLTVAQSSIHYNQHESFGDVNYLLIFYFLMSVVNIRQSDITTGAKQLMMINSSNLTMNHCIIEGLILLGNSSGNYFVSQNSGGPKAELRTFSIAGTILLDHSEISLNVNNVNSLRLAFSSVSMNQPLYNISQFLTWHSTVKLGPVSLSTNSSDFLHEVIEILKDEFPNTTDLAQASTLPEHHETRFASGEQKCL